MTRGSRSRGGGRGGGGEQRTKIPAGGGIRWRVGSEGAAVYSRGGSGGEDEPAEERLPIGLLADPTNPRPQHEKMPEVTDPAKILTSRERSKLISRSPPLGGRRPYTRARQSPRLHATATNQTLLPKKICKHCPTRSLFFPRSFHFACLGSFRCDTIEAPFLFSHSLNATRSPAKDGR